MDKSSEELSSMEVVPEKEEKNRSLKKRLTIIIMERKLLLENFRKAFIKEW